MPQPKEAPEERPKFVPDILRSLENLDGDHKNIPIYSGEYPVTIDAKGRFAIPTELRRLNPEYNQYTLCYINTTPYGLHIIIFVTREESAGKTPLASIPTDLRMRIAPFADTKPKRPDPQGRILISTKRIPVENWVDGQREVKLVGLGGPILEIRPGDYRYEPPNFTPDETLVIAQGLYGKEAKEATAV